MSRVCITVTTGWRALPPIDNDPLELTRAALAGRRAWLVGGAVRDRLLGRRTEDLDVVLDGEPREAARALARTARAAAFALSEEYGGWRVVARDGAWQVDFERLRGVTLEEDLALRDFTVNAIAQPLGEPGTAPGEAIDPCGGLEDLARRRLREVGPRVFADDPLRVLRLVRLAVELDFEADADTRASAQAHAEALGEVAPERIFMELRRILDAPRAVGGLELMGALGATTAVLPELEEPRDAPHSHLHRDVYGHALEVLQQAIALQENLTVVLGGGEDERCREAVAALLAEPLADGLTRGGALRWGALLAEVRPGEVRPGEVRPAEVRPADGRVTFMGHEALGAQLAGEVLGRLRASGRLRAHVAALVRNYRRLGFLVPEPQPIARRTVFAYLRGCEPVEVDVTLLSVADRLAERSRDGCSREEVDAHLRLAREMLLDALAWHAQGPPAPLLRGDELAGELGIPVGPRVGELLEELAASQYAGEITDREEALAHLHAVSGSR